MKIVFTGDRNWNNLERVRQVFATLSRDAVIIVGDCRGADYLVNQVAKEYNHVVKVYKAYWDKYGDSAGPIRNKKMIDDETPNIIIAFHNDITNSKGTKNTLNEGKLQSIPCYLVTDNSVNLW